MSRALAFVAFPVAIIFAAASLKVVAAGNDFARQLNDAFIGVFEKVAPAVVVIHAEHKITDEEQNAIDSFDFFFRDRDKNQDKEADKNEKRFRLPEPPQRSEASGFFIRADGYILTNNHAVEEADKLDVRLKDGRHFPAKIVGRDDKTDIAVIKIDGKNFPTVEIADSDAVKVGQMVCAIGVPYNLDYSFTCGWVSAKGRSNLTSTAYEDYIQTDAFINPGNSGGPLIDLDGRVIGMNTLINGIARGLSFAIPSNMLRDIGDQLIATGKVTRSWLGLVLAREDDERVLNPEERGAVVLRIQADTPAFKSDLRPGDVITQVDGVRILNGRDLQREIVKKKIGAHVDLKVMRDGKTVQVPITTAALPDDVSRWARNGLPKKKEPSASVKNTDFFGMKLQELDKTNVEKFKIEAASGVLVSEVAPGSLAAQAEVQAGDVIIEVDHQPVEKLAQGEELLGNHNPRKNLLLFIDRQGRKTFTVLRLEK